MEQKRIYRYLGTGTEIGPLKLDRFGQRVEMEPDIALNAQLGGCALIPDEKFQEFGFTQEDLKVWADPFIDPFDVPSDAGQAKAKAAFIERQVSARMAYAQLRQGLAAERLAQEQAHGEMPDNQTTDQEQE